MSEKRYISQSGTFLCNEQSIALEFLPAPQNIIGDGSCRTFLVPEGVTGFCGGFGRGIRVTERFQLPGTVRSIGSPDPAQSADCVFANAVLPAVILPESLEAMGPFAFGDSRIDILCLPKGYTSRPRPYLREFKDCRIGRLYLHESARTDLFTGLRCRVEECFTYTQREEGKLPEESKQVFDLHLFFQKLQFGGRG